MMLLSVKNTKESKDDDEKSDPAIRFSELISKKIVELDKSVYSMIKSMKNDTIQFYFSDRLFNTNIHSARYFLFNNQTNQNFLMSSADEEYAKYFLFPDNSEIAHE